MMSLIIVIIMFFFVISWINKSYMQLVYSINLFILFIYFIMKFYLNNLNMMMNLYYVLGMDFYSKGLILLTLWIILLGGLSSKNFFIMEYNNYFVFLINMILIFLVFSFSSVNMILFYIFFESSLIPVFMFIMGWGFQVERIQAGMYMMLYTLFGSMPLFMIINYLYICEDTLIMDLVSMSGTGFMVYISLILAFLIKMPMYLMHLWLPKAHVEAPVSGSMILAGVMLKLGSYGIMRVMFMMLNLCMKFNKFFIIVSLVGGLISSLICLSQVDMKMLVAYSSVVHMSVLMSGLMTLFNWGILGGYLMMLSHGLCSSGLFMLVNINYERLKSRSLYINKGMLNYFPSLSLMWFFMCSSNLSFPPSLNLFSEIMLFCSLVIWSKLVMLILVLVSFFSACYTLYLYSFSQHGKLNNFNYFLYMVSVSEFVTLILHWVPLNFMFIYMLIFI